VKSKYINNPEYITKMYKYTVPADLYTVIYAGVQANSQESVNLFAGTITRK